MTRPVRLDGGLATTLQARGLPRFSPVEPWVARHPDAIVAAQRAFVDAGAEILLTATFRCLPSERSDWRAVAEAAVDLAREAAAGRAAVWLSLGPGAGHADVVAAVGDRVDGVVLETFTATEPLRDALVAVRAAWAGPLVGCLVPIPGLDPAAAAASVLAAGATGVGFNCGSVGAVLDAVNALPPGVPVWAKPNDLREPGAAIDALATRCAWLGGCCGTDPDGLARALGPIRR